MKKDLKTGLTGKNIKLICRILFPVAFVFLFFAFPHFAKAAELHINCCADSFFAGENNNQWGQLDNPWNIYTTNQPTNYGITNAPPSSYILWSSTWNGVPIEENCYYQNQRVSNGGSTQPIAGSIWQLGDVGNWTKTVRFTDNRPATNSCNNIPTSSDSASVTFSVERHVDVTFDARMDNGAGEFSLNNSAIHYNYSVPYSGWHNKDTQSTFSTSLLRQWWSASFPAPPSSWPHPGYLPAGYDNAALVGITDQRDNNIWVGGIVSNQCIGWTASNNLCEGDQENSDAFIAHYRNTRIIVRSNQASLGGTYSITPNNVANNSNTLNSTRIGMPAYTTYAITYTPGAGETITSITTQICGGGYPTENCSAPNTTSGASANQIQNYGGLIVFTLNITPTVPTADLVVNGETDDDVTITAGDDASYVWSSTNATPGSGSSTLSISPDATPGPPNNDPCGNTDSSNWVITGTSGSIPPGPTCSTAGGYTYTVTYTVDGPGGPASDTVIIRLVAGPTPTLTPTPTGGGLSVNLIANPASITSGGSSTLTWATSGDPTFCGPSSTPTNGQWNGGGSKDPSGGSQNIVGITQTTTFTITCSKVGAPNASASTTVTVGGGGQFAVLTMQPPTITIWQGEQASYSVAIIQCTGLWSTSPAILGGQHQNATYSWENQDPNGFPLRCDNGIPRGSYILRVTTDDTTETGTKTLMVGIGIPGGIASALLTVNALGPASANLDVRVSGTSTWGNSVTVGSNQHIDYQWSGSGGTFYSSVLDNVSPAGNPCYPFTPFIWFFNGDSGQRLNYGIGTTDIRPCEVGYTYTFIYRVFGPGPGGVGFVIRAQDSVTVTVTAPSPPTASSVTVAQPDYCVSGPAAMVNWTYSDPEGTPQSAYQVQVDDIGSAWNPPLVFDCTCSSGVFSGSACPLSGSCSGSATTLGTGNGIPPWAWQATYKARVRVWDSNNDVSGWTESSSWTTPKHAYPNVNLSWSPLNPSVNQPVQFTDLTQYFDGSGIGQRGWSWLFKAPSLSPSSVLQNPTFTYDSPGSYFVRETVTDKDGYSCTSGDRLINIGRPIPIWQEVSPK